VTGFGQTGPERDRPGFGTSAEAASGFAAINGEADGPPLLPGFALADATAGLAGAFLTLAALQGRAARGGRGQIVDLAIYEPLLTVMGPQLIEFDQLGLVQGRTGSRTPLIAPRNTYRTRDGRWIALSGASPSVFERLCRSLGVPELPADARFRDNQARLANVEALDDALQAAVARFDQADLLARLDAAEAVAAPVRGVDEVLADPHYRARGSIATVDDAELGPLRMQNAIGRLSATPGGIRHAGPRLGEHNRAVLVDELGFAPAELRAGGIVL
jgi:crotonobetainyl-CoA:carnitine CoA-transferase CaiB-like acyl-CoA transferase